MRNRRARSRLDIIIDAIALISAQAEFGRQATRLTELYSREIQRARQFAVAKVTHSSAQFATQLTGRHLRNHVNGSTGGIATEQGALGASQDFDALYLC